MKRIRVLTALSLLASLIPPASGAPISFNTAMPVHDGGWLFREEAMSMVLHDDPSPMDRKMDVLALPSVLVYGASAKLALIGVVPYVDKELRMPGVKREASGLGDVMTMARYQVFESDAHGRTLRGAMLAGLKWPTGSSRLADSLGLLPTVVQPGSGSYDPIIGSVWTAQWLGVELDADAVYQRSTWANDFKFGDTVTEDISAQYRLLPRRLNAEGVPSYLYAVLEANSVWQAENQAGGQADPNSGGYQLFLTPGLQWVTKRIVFELATQLPAVQSLNGIALKTSYNLIGGFRVWL